MVREADLAGTGRADAAADQAGVGDGVMRRAERTVGEQARAGREQAGDAVDLVVSSASGKVSGGRMPARRLASIVLPEPGGPIISTLCDAGGGDLEGALGRGLAADVGEIERGFAGRGALVGDGDGRLETGPVA